MGEDNTNWSNIKYALVNHLKAILPVRMMVHHYGSKSAGNNGGKIARVTCSTLLTLLHSSRMMLLDALDAVLHDKPCESNTVDPLVAAIADAQAIIGWYQILKGTFVTK